MVCVNNVVVDGLEVDAEYASIPSWHIHRFGLFGVPLFSASGFEERRAGADDVLVYNEGCLLRAHEDFDVLARAESTASCQCSRPNEILIAKNTYRVFLLGGGSVILPDCVLGL